MHAPSFTGIISPFSHRGHRWSRPCIDMKFQTRVTSLHSARGALHHPHRRGENSLSARASRHRTDGEIEKIRSSHFIELGDFDKPMSVRYWEDWYEIQSGPLARAYHLLQKIDLGPERGSERGTAPRVQHRIPPRRQYTLCQREGYVVAVAFTGPSYRSRHTDQDRGGRLEPRYYRGAKAASARTNNPVSWCGPRRPAREGRHGKHRSM